MKKIILASKSPRRKEILEMLSWNFEIDSKETDEIFDSTLSIEENMKRISLNKAKAVEEKYQEELILACDTLVIVDGKVLGKPKNREEAKQMLRLLSGRESYVYSSVTLLDKKCGREESFVEKTKIFFHSLSEKEIDSYIATGEADDKAGAYAIQGQASVFIEKIEGDYWNVVGLPISRIYQILKEWNYI